nr:peptidase S10, serine carboxypeptidase, alpha/beta hydrolase fold protein [Tanacetum cinerariifolium]
MMEVDAASSQGNNIRMKEVINRSSISIKKQPLEVPTSRNEVVNNSVNDKSSTPVCINHGATAWNEKTVARRSISKTATSAKRSIYSNYK